MDICYQEGSSLSKIGPFFIQGVLYCVLIQIAGTLSSCIFQQELLRVFVVTWWTPMVWTELWLIVRKQKNPRWLSPKKYLLYSMPLIVPIINVIVSFVLETEDLDAPNQAFNSVRSSFKSFFKFPSMKLEVLFVQLHFVLAAGILVFMVSDLVQFIQKVRLYFSLWLHVGSTCASSFLHWKCRYSTLLKLYAFLCSAFFQRLLLGQMLVSGCSLSESRSWSLWGLPCLYWWLKMCTFSFVRRPRFMLFY